MTTYADIKKMIEENDVEYVDVRFTDPRGKLQHLAMCAHAMDEDAFNEGIMFDGSSIAGWKAINESDMLLVPDMETAVMDPFTAQPQLIIFCDVKDPITGELYERDPRGTAKKAEQLVKDSGLGTDVFFGPEAEFFMFDDVRFSVEMNRSFFEFYSEEGPYASGDEMEGGNMGHRPGVKGGYFPVNPVDQSGDIRAEMTSTLLAMGVDMDKHHHEVAPSQHELGMTFDHLTRVADKLQLYKYVVHNVAACLRQVCDLHAKARTGRQRHRACTVTMSIWKDGKPLFAGDKYAGLSTGSAVLHRRHPQARQGAQRLHQPVHQLLQASGPGLRGPGSAAPTPPATGRAACVSRGPKARRPSASRPASPIRQPTLTCALPLS